jgi:2-dehydro-3-deoxyphosphooctonate aldolase (KDO 8-P synthase)
MITFNELKNNFFIMAGPNVIESEEFVLRMAKSLKNIFEKYNTKFIFKVSFDKANRTSADSFRGVSMEEGVRILKRVRNEVKIPIITDIHESYQAEIIAPVVDVIQIPAFLCRQTDLLKAAAETGKIIQGNSFGYQDLIVDPRNLIWLKSNSNLVSMDITHCLQQPAQKMPDGTIKAGGLREFIPWMGKMARALDVDGIFMEVHENPEKSLCDAPTQWPLDKLEWLLNELI